MIFLFACSQKQSIESVLELPSDFDPNYFTNVKKEDLSSGVINKIQLKACVQFTLDSSEVLNNIKSLICEAYNESSPDMVSVLIYKVTDDLNGEFSVAKGVFAPYGDWESTEKPDDLSLYELNVEYVGNYFSGEVGSPKKQEATYDNRAISSSIKSLLEYMDVNVQEVKIADGSSNGGTRNLIMSIIANPDRSKQAAELTKVMECGIVANDKHSANIDETTVVVGDVNGDALAMITVKLSDTEIFQRTKKAEAYVKKWTVLRYDENYLSNLLSLAKNP